VRCAAGTHHEQRDGSNHVEVCGGVCAGDIQQPRRYERA
jgi:hypothetical protein